MANEKQHGYYLDKRCCTMLERNSLDNIWHLFCRKHHLYISCKISVFWISLSLASDQLPLGSALHVGILKDPTALRKSSLTWATAPGLGHSIWHLANPRIPRANGPVAKKQNMEVVRESSFQLGWTFDTCSKPATTQIRSVISLEETQWTYLLSYDVIRKLILRKKGFSHMALAGSGQHMSTHLGAQKELNPSLCLCYNRSKSEKNTALSVNVSLWVNGHPLRGHQIQKCSRDKKRR